jgi:excinuclease UvrABC ATPase subunit
MARADWIIDLGPGAGHEGGRVVFEGTPAEMVAGKSTLTGKHLAAFVGSGTKVGARADREQDGDRRGARRPIRSA